MSTEDDVTQVVYIVAHENGDDMCGGLNLHGIYTSEDAAKARLDEVVWEGFVYPVPLNIPGWLGYGSTLYDRHAASEDTPPLTRWTRTTTETGSTGTVAAGPIAI